VDAFAGAWPIRRCRKQHFIVHAQATAAQMAMTTRRQPRSGGRRRRSSERCGSLRAAKWCHIEARAQREQAALAAQAGLAS
jgi:hypothetical protein